MTVVVYGTDGTGPGGKGRSSVVMGDDAGVRLQWVSNEFGARGKRFSVTEGYRPVGVPADRFIKSNAFGLPVTPTSTGGSNQYFQKGREDRGETPSAATPGTSEHGLIDWGTGAIDCDVDDMALRAQLMGVVGLFRTVPAESWHFAVRRNPEAWWDLTKVTFPGAATPAPPSSNPSALLIF